MHRLVSTALTRIESYIDQTVGLCQHYLWKLALLTWLLLKLCLVLIPGGLLIFLSSSFPWKVLGGLYVLLVVAAGLTKQRRISKRTERQAESEFRRLLPPSWMNDEVTRGPTDRFLEEITQIERILTSLISQLKPDDPISILAIRLRGQLEDCVVCWRDGFDPRESVEQSEELEKEVFSRIDKLGRAAEELSALIDPDSATNSASEDSTEAVVADIAELKRALKELG